MPVASAAAALRCLHLSRYLPELLCGRLPDLNAASLWLLTAADIKNLELPTDMDKNAAAAVEPSATSERQSKGFDDPKSRKPGGGGGGGGGDVSGAIMPHLLNLYGSCATARDFEIYAPNATFEDPLMCAHGVKQIKSAFYSLPKIFSESRIVEYTVQENATAPGQVEILIDNKQHYKIFGRDVDLKSLIKLKVEGGKVIRHEDWWDGKPLKNRDSVQLPFLGRMAEITRRGSMFVTHAMMGFGKDPSN